MANPTGANLTFETSDLGTVAYLLEKGHKLKEVRTEGQGSDRKTTFQFENFGNFAHITSMEYMNGGSVSAIKFAERLRKVKRIAVRVVIE